MAVSPSAIGAAVSQTTEGKPRKAKNQLGQDEFLKLLTTQLKSQDPMKPVEDTQFIAQMAQFSSLNQMQELNKNFEGFNKKINENQELQTLAQASSLIGRQVFAGSSIMERGIGTVTQIRHAEGKVSVVLKGVDHLGDTFTDRAYDLSKVQQVGVTPDEVKAFEAQVESGMALRGAIAAQGMPTAPKLPDGFTAL